MATMTSDSMSGLDSLNVTANPMSRLESLPEDLLLLILNRTNDLKFLSHCLLVSKYFASVIHRVQTVSLTLPGEPQLSASDIRSLIFAMKNCKEFPEFIQMTSFDKLKFCKTLKNFRELKSVHVEYTYPVTSSHGIKWWAIFRGAKLVVLYCISDSDFSRISEHNSYTSGCPSLCISEWLMVACLLIKCHDMLQNVTVKDSNKRGKVVLRDSQLCEWRKNFFVDEFLEKKIFPVPTSLMSGTARDLNFQFSRYRTKDVSFMRHYFLPLMEKVECDIEDDFGEEVKLVRAAWKLIRPRLLKMNNIPHWAGFNSFNCKVIKCGVI